MLRIGNVQQSGEILVICINYHTDADTKALVTDLLTAEGVKVSVLVVDNSQPSTLKECLHDVVAGNKNISILIPKENLGYYGAAAWALDNYLSARPLPDWTVVSNVDLRIREKDFFKRLTDHGAVQKFAVIAPAISSELSNRDQNPFMRIRPNPWRMRFYKTLFKHYPVLVIYSLLSLLLLKLRSINAHSEVASGLVPSPTPIYAPHGSFVAFRKDYFEKGGTLNHPVFLFGEEIFIAETALRLGLAIGYDPRLRVVHREHKSTGLFPSRKMAAFISEAATYCADQFFANSSHSRNALLPDRRRLT